MTVPSAWLILDHLPASDFCTLPYQHKVLLLFDTALTVQICQMFGMKKHFVDTFQLKLLFKALQVRKLVLKGNTNFPTCAADQANQSPYVKVAVN